MRASLRLAASLGLLLAAAAAFPQEKAPESKVPESKAPAPEQYGKDEFSPFLKALRRGEIILFGSFPISLFVTFEVYDIGRYFANDRQPEYAPWPFRSPNPAQYTEKETVGVLIAAVSVSLALAVTDYVIGRIIAKRGSRRLGQGR
jgi:hypothetical protein